MHRVEGTLKNIIKKNEEIQIQLLTILESSNELSLDDKHIFQMHLNEAASFLKNDIEKKIKRNEEEQKKVSYKKAEEKNIISGFNIKAPAGLPTFNLMNENLDEQDILDYLKFTGLINELNCKDMIEATLYNAITSNGISLDMIENNLEKHPFCITNKRIAIKVAKYIVNWPILILRRETKKNISKDAIISDMQNKLNYVEFFTNEELAKLQSTIEKRFSGISKESFIQEFKKIDEDKGLVNLNDLRTILTKFSIFINLQEFDYIIYHAIIHKKVFSDQQNAFLFDSHALMQLFQTNANNGINANNSNNENNSNNANNASNSNNAINANNSNNAIKANKSSKLLFKVSPVILKNKFTPLKIIRNKDPIPQQTTNFFHREDPYLKKIASDQENFFKNLDEMSSGKLYYIDSNFNYCLDNLTYSEPKKLLNDNVSWMSLRLDKVRNTYKLFDSISPDSVCQGSLGDCYLIAALACVASRPEIIKNLFCNKEANNSSFYGIWLFESGIRKLVLIDDVLPYYKDDNSPAFAHSSKTDIWPQLFEKACAKIFGGYQHLVSGSCSESFHLILGCSTKIIDLVKLENPKSYFDTLIKFSRRGFFMTCSTSNKTDDLGIQSNHAYSILSIDETEKVILLRNPWGKKGYKSQKLPLKYQNIKLPDEGYSYMLWSEFCSYFTELNVAKYKGDRFNYSCLRCSSASINMFQLYVSTYTEAFLSFHQVSKRKFVGNQVSWLRILIYRGEKEGKPLYLVEAKFKLSEMFGKNLNLEPGYYYVMIEGLWTNNSQKTINFGISSDNPVSFKEVSYPSPDEMIKRVFMADYLKNPQKYDVKKLKPSNDSSNSEELSRATLLKWGFSVIIYDNQTSKTYDEKTTNTIKNQKICAPFEDPCYYEVKIAPQQKQIVLYKAIKDPIQDNQVSYSYQSSFVYIFNVIKNNFLQNPKSINPLSLIAFCLTKQITTIFRVQQQKSTLVELQQPLIIFFYVQREKMLANTN